LSGCVATSRHSPSGKNRAVAIAARRTKRVLELRSSWHKFLAFYQERARRGRHAFRSQPPALAVRRITPASKVAVHQSQRQYEGERYGDSHEKPCRIALSKVVADPLDWPLHGFALSLTPGPPSVNSIPAASKTARSLGRFSERVALPSLEFSDGGSRYEHHFRQFGLRPAEQFARGLTFGRGDAHDLLVLSLTPGPSPLIFNSSARLFRIRASPARRGRAQLEVEMLQFAAFKKLILAVKKLRSAPIFFTESGANGVHALPNHHQEERQAVAVCK
jgi:hypothetical protein